MQKLSKLHSLTSHKFGWFRRAKMTRLFYLKSIKSISTVAIICERKWLYYIRTPVRVYRHLLVYSKLNSSHIKFKKKYQQGPCNVYWVSLSLSLYWPLHTGQQVFGRIVGWLQSSGGQGWVSHRMLPLWHKHWVQLSKFHVSPSTKYRPSKDSHISWVPLDKGIITFPVMINWVKHQSTRNPLET